VWRGLAELVDRAWPRVPLALLALSALVLAIALIASPKPSDTVQIHDLVHDFGKAAADRRGDDACRLLTPLARAEVTAQIPTEPCDRYVRSFGVGFDASSLGGATIRRVQIVGSRAAIARADLVDGKGDALGLAIGLQRVGGDWRIAGFKRG
jgi:hypothetical protein